jgi:superfamily II DNA or RNA helicase
MIKLIILDPVWAMAEGSKEELEFLAPCLSYKAQFVKEKPGRFSKEIKHYDKCIMSKKGLFPAGLVTRVAKYCKDRHKGVEIVEEYSLNLPYPTFEKMSLPDINLREDQARMVKSCYKKGRGIIKAPTGSGKTVIASALIQTLPDYTRVLFLCHTITLLRQTEAEFKRFLKKPIGVIGEGKCDLQQITVSTMQSFVKHAEALRVYFDCIIIDEAHHVSSMNGTYAQILSKMTASLRYGFTATPQTSGESLLAMEGFIGPVIDELSMEEGIETGILAKPRVKILHSPKIVALRQVRKYDDIYTTGVVENRGRNRLIASTTKELILQGKTVLIIVLRLSHAKILKEMLDIVGVDSFVMQGSTEGEMRQEVKQLFTDKTISCVIATAVWREGVNVPTLDCIINAAGGKSEIATLQALGRGLRTADGKDEALLIDIFDNSHPFLIDHFGERFCLYVEQGWV